MKNGWSEVALGEVLHWRAPDTEVVASESYDFAGAYSHGGGIFRKHRVSGSSIAYDRLTRLRKDEFVYPKLMAWEGALGLVPPSCDGCFVSPEFQVFRIDSARLHPRLFDFYMRRPRVWSDLGRLSPGTNLRRRRLNAPEFLKYRISMPPPAEQQRLVAHLDAIESRLARAQKLREEAITEAQAFTISLHHHLSKGRARSLGLVLQLDEEQEPVKVDGSYPQIGIRSFGEGMFRKPPTLGSETTYRSFNILRAGKLAMSQVKGWEGAVAVCPADLDGWFVSPEYRTFACRDGECDPDYLAHLVKTSWFHQRLASATRGVGARRERIRPEMLLSIEIPFPNLAGQKVALKSIEHLTRAQSLTNQLAPHAAALFPSLLERIFNS